MIKYTLIFLLLLSVSAAAQDTAVAHKIRPIDPNCKKHTYIATMALGFINSYKTDYTVPANFEKGNTTGFSPLQVKLEYCISNRVSLAFAGAYGTAVFNSFQLYEGNNGTIKRYKTNHWRILGLGLTAYYHLGYLIQVKGLDPFIGAGISLNNIRHSALPFGDSTIINKTHGVTPSIKAGARYYFSDKVSVFADAGYDKLSMFSLGFSCKVTPAKHKSAK
jgi:hypothetical protein